MQEILSKVKDGIQEIVPAENGFQVALDSMLIDIPHWDSLHSVTLHILLEDAFDMKIPFDLCEGETTIGEIVAYIGESRS